MDKKILKSEEGTLVFRATPTRSKTNQTKLIKANQRRAKYKHSSGAQSLAKHNLIKRNKANQNKANLKNAKLQSQFQINWLEKPT